MFIGFNEEDAKISKMIKKRIVFLLSYLLEENEKSKNPMSKDEVVAKFYSSKTYAYLINPETDFYWKSNVELKLLINYEYSGNTMAWECQA